MEMTWQQQQEQRYLDRLRERWNEDGTRKEKPKRFGYMATNEDVQRMAETLREAVQNLAETPSPFWNKLCNQ